MSDVRCRGAHAPRGMTLMETLVAIAILTAVVGIVTAAYVSMNGVYARVSARADRSSEGALFDRRFSTFARNASAVIASRTMGGTALASGSGTVILALPSVDASGLTIDALRDHAAFRFDAAAGTVRLIVESDAASARRPEDRVVLHDARAGGFRYDASPPDASHAISYGFVLDGPAGRYRTDVNLDATYALGNR